MTEAGSDADPQETTGAPAVSVLFPDVCTAVKRDDGQQAGDLQAHSLVGRPVETEAGL